MNYKCIVTCNEIEINLERTSEASALVDRDFFASHEAFIIIHTALLAIIVVLTARIHNSHRPMEILTVI